MRKTFLFAASILFCFIPLFAVEVQPVDLVYTNPGENCAESMGALCAGFTTFL